MSATVGSETVASVKGLKRFYCVELPCFVDSPIRALSMMGGEHQTIATLQRDGDATLSLQFPNDHSSLSNGIKGSASERRNGLLIKITRKKKKSKQHPSLEVGENECDEKVQTKVEILGFVEKTWTFSEPADYQVSF